MSQLKVGQKVIIGQFEGYGSRKRLSTEDVVVIAVTDEIVVIVRNNGNALVFRNKLEHYVDEEFKEQNEWFRCQYQDEPVWFLYESKEAIGPQKEN